MECRVVGKGGIPGFYPLYETLPSLYIGVAGYFS